MSAWVIALALVAVALLIILPKRQRLWRKHVREQSELHAAKLNALTEWLREPRIVDALVDYTPLTPAGIEALCRSLGSMDEGSLDNVLRERILASRNVRRVICHHVELAHQTPRFETMRALLAWSGKEL